MNTTKKTVRFTIDFINMNIVGTKTSFNKASKGFGPEYEELAAKMAAHPNFELVVKEPKHKSNKAKRTYDGLNFKFMEAFIETKEDAETVMKEYTAVKNMAKKIGTPKYPMTKKWFLNKFGSETKPFDMDAAKEIISDYRIAKAEKAAA